METVTGLKINGAGRIFMPGGETLSCRLLIPEKNGLFPFARAGT
jgi:hypothetical protein